MKKYYPVQYSKIEGKISHGFVMAGSWREAQKKARKRYGSSIEVKVIGKGARAK